MKPPPVDNRFFHPRWPVFHEDNHVLVVYKPALLPVQRGMHRGTSMLDLAKKWIGLRYSKPGRVFLGLVHRLDFPVAGVMAFARTSKSAGRLCAQFREGTVEKSYLAVVEGIPKAREEGLSQLLVRGEKRSRIAGGGEHGAREALLDYRVVDTFNGRALVEVDLKTGRKHQIRLQLSHLGHPVAGDTRYGAPSSLPGGRIALMSRRLVISHPTKSVPMPFECPVPAGWPWPKVIDGFDFLPPPWAWPEICSSREMILQLSHFSFDNRI